MTRGQHIELFAGLGSASIPLAALGFETIAWAECEPFCQSVLRKRFPSALGFPNVESVQANILRPDLGGSPLLVSGGFPCQDVSGIGRKAGISAARSGLWNEFARIVGELRPEYVVIENVGGLRTRGLDSVLMDLSDLGYNARWDTIPAAAAGALHRRARIFIVAAPDYGTPGRMDGGASASVPGERPSAGTMIDGRWHPAARRFTGPFPHLRYPTPRHAANEWRTTRNAPTHGNGHGKTLSGEANDLERARGATLGASSQSCGNVRPEWVEWVMGLPEGWSNPSVPNDHLKPFGGWTPITGPLPRTASDVPDRRGRLMALGNGLVPQQFALALRMLTELSPREVM